MKVKSLSPISKLGMSLAALVFMLTPALATALSVPDRRPEGLPENLVDGADSVFIRVTEVLLALVGAIAIIMLIVGGFRYVLSAGSQEAVQGAKNTILYAIIGIVVVFLSYAAVRFLVHSLNPPSPPTTQNGEIILGQALAEDVSSSDFVFVKLINS